MLCVGASGSQSPLRKLQVVYQLSPALHADLVFFSFIDSASAAFFICSLASVESFVTFCACLSL